MKNFRGAIGLLMIRHYAHWPVRVQGIGKDMPSNMLPLSTLNCWSFTYHIFWFSKPRLPKFPRWDSWAWIMNWKWDNVPWAWTMGFDEIISPWVSDQGFWCRFVQIWALLGFEIDLPKIHDNIDVVRVANKAMWRENFVLNHA